MKRSSGLAVTVAVLAVIMFPTTSFSATGPTTAPGAPTSVRASAGTLSATVSWTPSGATATSYTVVSIPGGVSTTVDGTVTGATVTGLGFLMSYTFSVTATNSIGTGPASALSNAITPLPPGGPYHQGFTAVLLNTTVSAGHPIATNFGDDPVHLPGISAVVVNVTTSQASLAANVQLVVNQQIVQAIEAGPGQIASSLAVIPVPAQLSQAAIQISSGSAHVEVDFVGYFTGPSSLRDHAGLLQMVHPAALLDASIATGGSIDIPVLGQGEIPSAHVAGVLLNVTAFSATGTGSFALSPSGTSATAITTVGFTAGQTAANRAIVALPATGAITLVDRGAAAGVRIEVLGWFTDSTDATAIGSLYTSIAPVRLVDTAAHGGQLPAGGSLSFAVWGRGGAPGSSATAPPTSALLQIAALSPAGPGSLAISGASVLDFAAGQTLSRVDVVQLAGDGSASLTVLGAAADVTVDLVAYFSGDMIVPGSTKVLSAGILAAITHLGSDLSITFAAGSQVSPPILLNDVIVASVSPTTPKGFLRRVLSITNLPTGEVVLGTRNAHLQEAVTAFSVEWVMPPNSGTFGAGLGRVGPAAAAPTASRTSFPPPLGTSIDPNWPVFSVAKPPQGIVVDLTNVIGGASELDINDLEFQALPHFKMTGNPFTGGTVHVAAGFSVGVRAAIELQLLGTINRKLTLFDEFFSSVVVIIFIGPVPLVFQPGTEVQVTLQLSLNGGVAVGFNLDRFGALSAGYDGTNFFIDPPVYKDYLTTAQSYTIRPVLQAQAEADVHIIPSLAFYDRLLSVGAEVKPYLRLTVDPTAPHWWSVSAGICRAFTLDLNLYFDQKAASFLPLCVEVEIAHAPGAKLIVTLLPTSATVARSATTHFQAGVANSNNGVIWSINEGSAGGSLSNANQIDVDYKAPAVAGTYHLHAAAIDDPTSFTEAVITVQASAPGAPTNVTAAAGTGSAAVSWTAPADNGGAPLTGYQVTIMPGGATLGVNGTTTTLNAAGLIPGGTYTFTVTATNSAGLTSLPSNPSPPTTIPSAQIVLQPSSINFGVVAVGQSSPPQTITVTADPAFALKISTVTLVGANSANFAIQSDLCSGQALPAGGSCTFAVVYTPTTQLPVTAAVSIADDDLSSPQTIPLSGTSASLQVLCLTTTIAGGTNHTVAVDATGHVFAWGANKNGELGNGTNTASLIAVPVSTATGLPAVSSVAAGLNFTVVRGIDGTVWSWGFGPLGNVNFPNGSNVPVQVQDVAGSGFLTGIAAVSASDGAFAVATKASDGSVWAWGDNSLGQLGNGGGVNSPTPVQVLGPGGVGFLTGVVQIAAGAQHVVALKADGTVWAWGRNDFGELGSGTASAKEVFPVQVAGPNGVGFLTGVTAIGTNSHTSVAALTDGTVYDWGNNAEGQLGNGTIGGFSVVPISAGGLSGLTGSPSVTTGFEHALALDSNSGKAWAWGWNVYGQLGDGTQVLATAPVQVIGSIQFTEIAAGAWDSFGLAADGTIWGWGINDVGELGNGRTGSFLNPTPGKVLNVSAAQRQAC